MTNTIHARAATALLAAAVASTFGLARADDAAPMKVACTLPHLAAHAREIAGDKASVVALGRGDQDPHFVQPTPVLMVQANEAQMYIEVGLELELWSEHVIDGARNERIRVNNPGHVYASAGATLLERPAVLSRSQGDVHPYGNPHIWMDPLNAIVEANNIAQGLAKNDAANAAEYEKRGKAYTDRLRRLYFGDALVDLLGAETLERLQRSDGLFEFLEKKKYKGEPLTKKLGGWLGKLYPYRGRRIISFHRDMSYFAKAFGVDVAGTLEPKPGIAPTPGHLSELEEMAKASKVDAVVCMPYHNVGLAEDFAKRIGVPSLVVQIDCGATEATRDYPGLMSAMVDALAGAFAKGSGK